MQTKPKFTGTAGGERCCGAIVGKPTKPHRACYGARSRPRLAWELLGGPGGLAEPLAAPPAPALASTLSSTRRSRLRTPRTVLSRPAGALALVLTAAALAAAAACICRFGAGPRSLYCPRSPAQCSRVGSTHHRAHRGHRWALLLVLAALGAALAGVMTNLFEQVDRRSEQRRREARQQRRGSRP